MSLASGVVPSMSDSRMKQTKKLMCENRFKFYLEEAKYKKKPNTHSSRLTKKPNQLACGYSLNQKYSEPLWLLVAIVGIVLGVIVKILVAVVVIISVE